jgi:hypothetical protein
MPNSVVPSSASPESFTRMRLYGAVIGSPTLP